MCDEARCVNLVQPDWLAAVNTVRERERDYNAFASLVISIRPYSSFVS